MKRCTSYILDRKVDIIEPEGVIADFLIAVEPEIVYLPGNININEVQRQFSDFENQLTHTIDLEKFFTKRIYEMERRELLLLIKDKTLTWLIISANLNNMTISYYERTGRPLDKRKSIDYE